MEDWYRKGLEGMSEDDPEYQEMMRKKFAIHIQDFVDGKSGADYVVLECLTYCVSGGRPISQELQQAANLIVARSICKDSLPAKKKGRPKDKMGIDADLVTEKFIEFVDGGSTYADAVANLAEEFHKDERHISRIVSNRRGFVSGKQYLAKVSRQFPELQETWEQMEYLWKKQKESMRAPTDPEADALSKVQQLDAIDAKIAAFAKDRNTTDSK